MSFTTAATELATREQTESNPTSRRVPALDGLRAVAVVGVMAFHSDIRLPGGFVGVDIFFVLSGFLICQLLLKSLNGNRLRDTFGTFWLARARRIFPALVIVLLAVGYWRYFYLSPSLLSTWTADIVAATAFVTNWLEILRGNDYFALGQGQSPLLQTWSLSIEEQYYLIFPFMLVFLTRVQFFRRNLAAVLASLAVVSASWMAYLTASGADLSRIYFGTDTRAQGLLLGSALGAWTWDRANTDGVRSATDSSRSNNLLRLGMWLAVVGLIGIALVASEQNSFSVVIAISLACVLSAVLIIGLTSGADSGLTRLFGCQPLVAVGTISYGLYLWHWPVFHVINHDTLSLPIVALVVVQFAVTGALAYASYLFIETPVRFGVFRRLRPKLQWTTFAAAAAAVLLIAFAQPTRADAQPTLPIPIFDRSQIPSRIFVGGDSVALMLANYPEVPKANGARVSSSTLPGCGLIHSGHRVAGELLPKPSNCNDWALRWTDRIADADPQASIIQASYLDMLDSDDAGQIVPFGSPSYRTQLDAAFDQAIAVAGKDGQIPVYITNMACTGMEGKSADVVNDTNRQQQFNSYVAQVAAEHPRTFLVDSRAALCPLGVYTAQKDGVELFKDGAHPNAAGANLVWTEILEKMEQTYQPTKR